MTKKLGNNFYAKPPNGSQKKRMTQHWTAQLGKYLAITTQNLSLIGAGGGLGWFLDRELNTDPFLLIVGIFGGAGAGFYHLLRFINSEQKKPDD